MATYFVDGTNGSDTNAGTSATTAWATVGHAASYSSLAAGDTVWIAPGTYFETLTFSVDGTSGSPILWKGDPDCTQSWSSGVEPGPVKISGADSSTLVPASTGTVITLTGVEYNEFYDLYFDGIDITSSSNYIVRGDSSAGQKFVRCSMVGGYYGVYQVALEYCFVLGGYYGVYYCNSTYNGYVKNSIVISGYNSGEYSSFDQCIILGANYAVDHGYAKNCFIYGAYCYGYANSGGAEGMWNSIAIGRAMGYGDADIVMENNFGLVRQDAGGAITADWSTCKILKPYTTNVSTPPGDAHIFTFPPPMQMIRNLSQAFKFTEYNDYGIGDDTNATSETLDMEGRARSYRPADETSDQKGQGPWALADYSLKRDATDGNKIRIEKKGEEVLYIPLKADTAITISVDVDCGNMSGTPIYPQIALEPVISGDFTAPTADTATSTSDTLTQSLTVSTAPDKDCMARLVLKGRETASNAYAEFYNIEVS